MTRFSDLIKERTLLCDGAMGTMLQKAGITAGACPELLNVEDPETIMSIHRAYVLAGADIITTNTFGGTSAKLGAYGLENRTEELSEAGVRIARKAADGKALVGGSIGPTGRFVTPVGDMTFDEALEIFTRQARAITSAGADLILLETFSDIKEIRAAVIAVLMHLVIIAFLIVGVDWLEKPRQPKSAVEVIQARVVDSLFKPDFE